MKILLIILILISSLYSNKADVIAANVTCNKKRLCTFSVTVKHQDQSWKHFAHKWEVLTLNKKLLGTRILYHPHIKEQPFTRKLKAVKIPKNVKSVIIRAKDKVHGYGGKELILKID